MKADHPRRATPGALWRAPSPGSAEPRLGNSLPGFTALVLVLAALLTSGCAAYLAHREGTALVRSGEYEQGLEKLEEAVTAEPDNVEYRISLLTTRSMVVNQLIAAAEAARRAGNLNEAEKGYVKVLASEPTHAMARQGLDAVTVERRHRAVIAEAEAIFKKGDAASLSDALTRLHPVLAENPTQRDALNLKARIEEALTREQQPEAKLAESYRKPITLEFRDAPLKSIFDAISKISDLNFFFDREIRSDLRATLYAKDTSVEDAVRMLLATNQLEQKVLNEKSILIYPRTPQKLKDYKNLSVRTFHVTNADVKTVANSIKTILKTQDMVVDERLGLIIMRDAPEVIRMAERLVKLQDLSDPEVMLEVEVLEIKRSRILELGLRWPDQVAFGPLPTDGVLTLADLEDIGRSTTQVSVGNFIATARRVREDGNILANPRIRVRNKEKAQVLIGDRIPVITTTSTSTGFVSESVNYLDVGLKLDVEPNIYLDEEVAIKINLEVSTLVREVVSQSGTLAYQIGTRSANTVLRLKDNETQILAGLISDEDRVSASKIPLIGELPLLGRLFGSQKDDSQRSEIVLSITPRIVRTIRRPDLVAAEFESGTESSVGAPALAFSSVTDETAPGDGGVKVGAAVPEERAPSATAIPEAAPAAEPPAEPEIAAAESAPAYAGDLDAPAASESGVGRLTFEWQAPTQVRSGEQFSAVLIANADGLLEALPLLLSYDPQALQIVRVDEGDLMSQGGGQTEFKHRIDVGQGKIFVSMVRKSELGVGFGVAGSGRVLSVTLKAIKPGTTARLQLVSATPEPKTDFQIQLPVQHAFKVVP